ncbi:hypothetical protein [Polluticoccus soli]|uniref:hypothetical protein n=1 Tax=Polluticoccus soli TaxID=3034150 RepID=UPI0023E27B70|nr:hypothetical protein [Flavipsychrobacter sp. JY13-12]
MITSVEIFDTIRRLSPRTLTSRPRVPVSAIADELAIPQDDVLVLLAELKNRGLIEIHKGTIVSVSLTTYGADNETPSGGLLS